MEGGGSIFWWTLFGYMLCYMPTLGLSNSLALAHIENSEKQFPVIRVFGTIGWIAAGFVIAWQKVRPHRPAHADRRRI